MTSDLQTLAEESGFTRTGRGDEVERLCAAYAERWPDAVRMFEYGRSSEQRSMLALLVTRSGRLDAASLRAASIPLLFIQAGIHPGESDGKDAGFIALRELLEGRALTRALERIAILFVPAFNVDGHERMGRWNRPNQNGPRETGWRVTARNLNLNRDYCKADTPEMQALLRLITHWDPLICADLHVTDGADFQPDISLQAEPINQGDPALRAAATQLRDEVIARLSAQGSKPLPFYPDFYVTDDPSSGFVLTVYSPRFSTGYFPQRNRFTLLVETHSWKDYRTRVHVTRNTIMDTIEALLEHGGSWLEQVRAADRAAARIAGAELVLDYRSGWREPGKAGSSGKSQEAEATARARMIDFPGYAYTRTLSAISGTLVTAYDPRTPQNWHVPYRDSVEPSVVVRTPKAGYVVPTAYAPDIGERLALHGIAFEHLPRAVEQLPAEHFRASRVDYAAAPFEGRMRARLEGAWISRTQTLTAGSLYVPLAQPLARLIAALLEPQAPDSFAAWGFFNACFEQKEQLEPYVAEQVAVNMLNENAALASEFRDKLKQDAVFAADPVARLEFFLRRHNSWDERHNLYPIYRVDAHPARPRHS
jgi:murein tripeptide amidase MpaA